MKGKLPELTSNCRMLTRKAKQQGGIWPKAADGAEQEEAKDWEPPEINIEGVALSPEYLYSALGATSRVEGTKHDDGKPQYDLLFADMPDAVQEVVKVLTYGAGKYDARNWRQVPEHERRYLSASMRHEAEYQLGNSLDADTDLHHLAHKICSDLFRLQLAMEATEK